jgi:hypothetical protein
MSAGKQHELVRDACLTIGHIIKTRLPEYLGERPVTVIYDAPSDEDLSRAKEASAFLLSIVWLDSGLSTSVQSTHQPIVHEEDDKGNIVEYRCGPPSFVRSRYMVTPWTDGSLDAQVLTGGIMGHFLSFPEISDDDIQGRSIRPDDKPSISIDEGVDLEKQIQLWDLWSATGQTYRPSLVLVTTLRMDSLRRTAIRRVREKVNIFRKVEG